MSEGVGGDMALCFISQRLFYSFGNNGATCGRCDRLDLLAGPFVVPGEGGQGRDETLQVP